MKKKFRIRNFPLNENLNRDDYAGLSQLNMLNKNISHLEILVCGKSSKLHYDESGKTFQEEGILIRITVNKKVL